MGFYDARCMITGVSLKGSGAALVLLHPQADRFEPIAVAIIGQYDRLGSIDMIDEDDNTAHILRYFLDKLATNEFVVDEEYLRGDGFPIESIENLLRGFERNMNDGDGRAVLHGQSIVFALIAATVWRAIGQANPAQKGDNATFRRLFGTSPVPLQIYGGHLQNVSRQLGEFAAVSDFLTARGMTWTPPTDWGQHYSDEMREYLAEARAAFHDSSLILQALQQYEGEVSDLLGD